MQLDFGRHEIFIRKYDIAQEREQQYRRDLVAGSVLSVRPLQNGFDKLLHQVFDPGDMRTKFMIA